MIVLVVVALAWSIPLVGLPCAVAAALAADFVHGVAIAAFCLAVAITLMGVIPRLVLFF